jgi:hypothetical protein
VTFNPQTILERKSTLFSVIVVGIVGILAMPIIIPHIFHGPHIFHIFLHVGGLILSIFISMLSILAYSRLKTKRLLLSSIAFAAFVATEIILMIDATWPFVFSPGNLSLSEIGHLLTFVTLGLLAIGVFRND